MAGSALHGAFVERVVELGAERPGVLVARVLAGVEQPAALVEVVAHLEQLVIASRDALPAAQPGLAGDDVVARVPDHRVVVAEHAEWSGATRPLASTS